MKMILKGWTHVHFVQNLFKANETRRTTSETTTPTRLCFASAVSSKHPEAASVQLDSERWRLNCVFEPKWLQAHARCALGINKNVTQLPVQRNPRGFWVDATSERDGEKATFVEWFAAALKGPEQVFQCHTEKSVRWFNGLSWQFTDWLHVLDSARESPLLPVNCNDNKKQPPHGVQPCCSFRNRENWTC